MDHHCKHRHRGSSSFSSWSSDPIPPSSPSSSSTSSSSPSFPVSSSVQRSRSLSSPPLKLSVSSAIPTCVCTSVFSTSAPLIASTSAESVQHRPPIVVPSAVRNDLCSKKLSEETKFKSPLDAPIPSFFVDNDKKLTIKCGGDCASHSARHKSYPRKEHQSVTVAAKFKIPQAPLVNLHPKVSQKFCRLANIEPIKSPSPSPASATSASFRSSATSSSRLPSSPSSSSSTTLSSSSSSSSVSSFIFKKDLCQRKAFRCSNLPLYLDDANDWLPPICSNSRSSKTALISCQDSFGKTRYLSRSQSRLFIDVLEKLSHLLPVKLVLFPDLSNGDNAPIDGMSELWEIFKKFSNYIKQENVDYPMEAIVVEQRGKSSQVDDRDEMESNLPEISNEIEIDSKLDFGTRPSIEFEMNACDLVQNRRRAVTQLFALLKLFDSSRFAEALRSQAEQRTTLRKLQNCTTNSATTASTLGSAQGDLDRSRFGSLEPPPPPQRSAIFRQFLIYLFKNLKIDFSLSASSSGVVVRNQAKRNVRISTAEQTTIKSLKRKKYDTQEEICENIELKRKRSGVFPLDDSRPMIVDDHNDYCSTSHIEHHKPTFSSCQKSSDQSLSSTTKKNIYFEEFYYSEFVPARFASRKSINHEAPASEIQCFYCCNWILLKDFPRHLLEEMITLDDGRYVPYQPAGMHVCFSHCFRSFDSSAELDRHFNLYLQVEPYSCLICQLPFKSDATRMTHMRSKHRRFEMPYVCSICGYRSSTIKDFDKHFNQFHDFVHCPFCPFVVTEPEYYLEANHEELSVRVAKHLAEHIAIRDAFACDRCSYSFLSADLLKAHRTADHQTVTTVINNNIAKQSESESEERKKFDLVAYRLSTKEKARVTCYQDERHLRQSLFGITDDHDHDDGDYDDDDIKSEVVDEEDPSSSPQSLPIFASSSNIITTTTTSVSSSKIASNSFSDKPRAAFTYFDSELIKKLGADHVKRDATFFREILTDSICAECECHNLASLLETPHNHYELEQRQQCHFPACGFTTACRVGFAYHENCHSSGSAARNFADLLFDDRFEPPTLRPGTDLSVCLSCDAHIGSLRQLGNHVYNSSHIGYHYHPIPLDDSG